MAHPARTRLFPLLLGAAIHALIPVSPSRAADAGTGAPAAAPADPSPPGMSVDFPGAVSRALSHHPAVVAAGFARDAARKEAEAARGGYLPSVAFEERFVRTDVPAEAFAFKLNQSLFTAADFAVSSLNDPPPRRDFVSTLSVEQPLFAPRAYLGYRMAGREAEAMGKDAARRKEDAVFGVLAAYLDVLTAKANLRVAAAGAEDAREHHRVAGAAEKAGMGLASDTLRARVFLAREESGLVGAENRLALARAGLALAMGEPGGTRADAAVPLPPLPEAGTLEERIEAARKNRADLAASALRAANAGTGVAWQRWDYLPTASAFGAWQSDALDNPFRPDNSSWKVGVGLKWNLFDGLRREASVGKADLLARAAAEDLRGAADRAAFEVTRAYLAVTGAEKRLAIARAALEAAEEGARLVKARYENQRARMIDLLDAQTALDGARADLVSAENDLALSRAGLEYASGTLLSWAVPGEEKAGEGGRP